MINAGQLPPGAESNEHIHQKMVWQRVNLRLETKNAFENYAICKEHLGGRILDLAELPRGVNRPLLICASGSSIDKVMPEIKDWKHDVMCTTSQAATLIYHGVHPDFIVALDPRTTDQDDPKASDEMAAPDWGQCKFLFHPSIPPLYLRQWIERSKAPAYGYRILEPSYDWYTHHLPWGYSHQRSQTDEGPWFSVGMLPFLDSSAAMISLAGRFGYNPIFCTGIDYGGPRFARQNYSMEDETWSLDVDSGYDAASDTSKKYGGGMTAKEVQTYSARGSLMAAYMQINDPQKNIRMYQLNGDSLFKLPAREWSRVLEDVEAEDRAYPKDDVAREIEVQLASWHTYVVRINMGGFFDHRVFVAKSLFQLHQLLENANHELGQNRLAFERMEKESGKPVAQMIKEGLITIEAGAILSHLDEIEKWDWRQMAPINTSEVMFRCMQRFQEATERGLVTEHELKASGQL